jgi:hypothetical protein
LRDLTKALHGRLNGSGLTPVLLQRSGHSTEPEMGVMENGPDRFQFGQGVVDLLR